ncbi:MAG TPA: uroporphyrinogen decarboxylase family protein [Burkholderiales bacterium]|nr:uroporphyrinogen decarboxylase family protein [Burkholderiales bacterium]
MLFPTTLVGSYPQPDWLIDRKRLTEEIPPRVRAKQLWRIDEAFLKEAQDDATLLAIRAQEDAGIDIVTDGEVRRESYSNRFATALEGIDLEKPGIAITRSGKQQAVPRIVGKIRRRYAVELEDLLFLKKNTTRKTKITVPGPFTMAQQAQNDYYPSIEAAAMDYAAAVNEEIRELFAAGADVVQIDEPYMQAQPEKAREYGVKALNRALQGIEGETAVHICFGYSVYLKNKPSGYSFLPEFAACSCKQISVETAEPQLDCSMLATLKNKKIMVGCLDLSDTSVESPQTIVERIKRAMAFVPKENIILAPDCGMKFLPRDSALGKLRSMVAAARLLREEFA